jgi:hypothetical protein
MNKSFSQNALREGTASQAVERPLVRIRVCLQAYRKLLKMSPALAAGVRWASAREVKVTGTSKK